MPMEEPDASADLNEEVGQTAVAEAVKERKIRQKLQLPANMQSETAENVPDSFYEQMTKECQKLVEYGVSSYHYSEAERRYLTALSAYRGQDCFELPEAVALPQVVDGKTIEAVESLAKTWGMKSVVIPKTVKEIEIGFIDGVEKICFEPGSCFRRFTPTGWSARGVLALEEVNFPTDADLLPLILLPGAKKSLISEILPLTKTASNDAESTSSIAITRQKYMTVRKMPLFGCNGRTPRTIVNTSSSAKRCVKFIFRREDLNI